MTEKQENKELNALIQLLDEPNENIFDTVRERIYTYGTDAIPSLEDAWENSFNDLIQERVMDIIHNIQFENVRNDLKNWKENQSEDLFQGLMLATKYQYPDIDENKIQHSFTRIIQDVWLELNNNLTALEKVKVLNHIIFDVHKIKSNKSNFFAPENFFLNNVFESKKGNPVSLGLLYAAISQSLQIPIFGLNLPRHFVLTYLENFEIEDPSEFKKSDVLFYINPFNKGTVFTRKEIEMFVKQLKLDPNEKFYQACSNVESMIRFFDDLSMAYQRISYEDKVAEIRLLRESLL